MVEVYAGLDVSDKATHVCVLDGSGAVLWAGACATDPEVIAKTLKTRAPGLVRVVLETGPLSAFLYHGLAERAIPVICICARHAKGVLSARVNKSDPHDAEGLAQMARTGWFKAVRIKQEATHLDRARLKIREQLIASRLAMAGQLRGLLKLFGLRLGKVTTPAKRRERLAALFVLKPEIEPVLAPLIESLEALEAQIRGASRQLAALAAADPVTGRLMTTPKPATPCCALPSTRRPTICWSGSSARAPYRPGARSSPKPRDPSAPASLSPASSPSCFTDCGNRKPSSAGPDRPPNHDRRPHRDDPAYTVAAIEPAGDIRTSRPHPRLTAIMRHDQQGSPARS